jgi:malonyl-CoA/methylmalonyl-CoA synthetase
MIESLLTGLEARARDEVLVGLDAGGRRVWARTGEELLLEAGGFQRLLAQRGVHAGDRVAIDVPRGPGLLAAHLGVLAYGACAVPINPSLSAPERARMLARADLKALLAADEPAPERASPRLSAARDGAPALLIFTSGTTGDPKGVPLTLENLASNLADLELTWQLGPRDRLLHVLPAHHVHGLVLALYGSVRARMTVVLAPRFDAEACLAALAAERISVMMGVPTMYHRLARLASVPALPDLRLFVSGSAPLAPEDFALFAARFGQPPLERYGLTETLIVSSNPLHGERRPGAVGHPLPSAELRLAEDGEIEVRGPSVMAGYWRDENASADVFRDGFFRTGDLGRRDDAGYLCIAGRKKELIIVGGSNVLPGEVERALAGDPQVDELAAVGVADPERGEVVAVFIAAAPGADAAAVEARLRARAEEGLAAYKRPRLYRFVAALPRSVMGKVDRRSLAALRS